MKKIFFCIMLVIAMACSSETELKKSIFIEDEDFPGLPVYSEWGYNSFGAYYDRQTFVSNYRDVPLKVIHQNNQTSFVFTGSLGTRDYYSSYSSELFTMTLTLANFNPTSYGDLASLHGVTLDLTDPAYGITLQDEFSTYNIRILSGGFEVKRAQYLLVDDTPMEVILSGVFEFQATINGTPVTFSDGRFDTGVGNDNFYNL